MKPAPIRWHWRLTLACLAGLSTCPSLAGEPVPTASSPTTSPTTVVEEGSQVVEAEIAAPVAEVWKVFSTPEGFKKLGVAQCELDLRLGGLIRTHYDPKGVLGDDGTIVNEILAFEPERMMAFRIHKPPRTFPFAEESWKRTWSVATFTDLGGGRTHLRLAGMGYTTAPDSQAMKGFFASGNAWVLQHLQKQFDAGAAVPQRAPHAADPLAPVRLERVVELPRPAVWNLLTTPSGWKRLLDIAAEVELRLGGPFVMHFQPDAPAGEQGSEGCSVLSFVPLEMLSFTWNAPPKFAKARSQHTWVVIRLDELSPVRTRIRLDHHGFAEHAASAPDEQAEWEQVRSYFQTAWTNVLTALAEQGGSRRAEPESRDQEP